MKKMFLTTILAMFAGSVMAMSPGERFDLASVQAQGSLIEEGSFKVGEFTHIASGQAFFGKQHSNGVVSVIRLVSKNSAGNVQIQSNVIQINGAVNSQSNLNAAQNTNPVISGNPRPSRPIFQVNPRPNPYFQVRPGVINAGTVDAVKPYIPHTRPVVGAVSGIKIDAIRPSFNANIRPVGAVSDIAIRPAVSEKILPIAQPFNRVPTSVQRSEIISAQPKIIAD